MTSCCWRIMPRASVAMVSPSERRTGDLLAQLSRLQAHLACLPDRPAGHADGDQRQQRATTRRDCEAGGSSAAFAVRAGGPTPDRPRWVAPGSWDPTSAAGGASGAHHLGDGSVSSGAGDADVAGGGWVRAGFSCLMVSTSGQNGFLGPASKPSSPAGVSTPVRNRPHAPARRCAGAWRTPSRRAGRQTPPCRASIPDCVRPRCWSAAGRRARPAPLARAAARDRPQDNGVGSR